MKSKAFSIAFPRKSRLGTFLSLAVVASLLTPLVPAGFGAGRAGAPAPAPRAVALPAALAVAPLISATKTDAFPDPDNDGKAVPGDTITYTVQINNSSSDATGVVFSDTVDANTTWGGTFTTTPVAIDDTYPAIGNVQINVPDGPGDLTSNDSDPDGGPVTAVAETKSSTNCTGSCSNNVTISADGSFSYNPPPGFEGADTFTYTINGASAPSNTSTVTVNVAGMIWFVDAAAALGGDGRLTSPFNALTGPGSFDAVAADQANDNIFLYSGAYTGGLSLLSGQALIGQGSTASLATVTGLSNPYSTLPATGGTNPVIGGTSGISIATNNLIRGVTIQNTAGTGISGTAFGTLAVAETAVDSGAGPALDLDNGQLQASFQSLTSTGSGTPGVSLTNIAVGSNFSGGTTTVNGRGATGIELDAVGGVIAFGATTIPNPGGAGGYGISVKNSTAAVSFASATISGANQTIAQADADSDLIPETDGDGDAIFLSNNTGSFAVNGGALSNCGNDCVDARNSSNVSLTGVAINFPGVDATGASGTGGSGIQGINLSGTNSLTNTNVQNFNVTGRDGVRLINNAAAAMTMTVSNSLVADSTSGGNGILISGRGNAAMGLVVNGNSTFQNLVGPAIAHRAGDNTDSTATVNLTVQNSTFQSAPAGGLNTVHAQTLEGGKATVLIGDNTFDNVARTLADTSGVIDINGDATDAGNSLSVNVTNNTIQNIGTSTACLAPTSTLPCTGRRGIDVFMDDNTNASGTIVIDGNQLSNIHRAGIILDTGTVFNGASYNAKITNNTVGTNAARVGIGTALSAGGESGIRIENRNNNSKLLNLNLSDNTVRNGNGGGGSALNTPGVFLRSQNAASFAATLTGNDIETSTSTVVAELRVDANTGSPVLCLDANGNTLDAGNGRIALNRSAGALDVEQTSATALATANGIPAGNVTVTGAVSFGVACASPPLAMFRTNTNREYLAALNVPSAKTAQGFAFFGALPGLDAWRTNSKTLFGGLSYLNAPTPVALTSGLFDPAVRPAREVGAPLSARAAAAAAPMPFSGENFNVDIGTLPAGKSMTITFQVTINNSIAVTQVSNQGTVSYTGGSVQTDDPSEGGSADPTVTPVFLGVPPEISCPADISVGTDPGASTASVSFNVTATGTPSPTVTCKIDATPITSPHTFPLGETTVSCTATNGVSPDDSCSFKVTVTDDEAPVIDCPDNITVSLLPNSNATTQAVNFTVTATDNVDPTPTINTDFPSGHAFPVGTTTVTATATDDAGNQSECQFTVTVLYNFAGFFSPVANPPVLNEVKAGQNIPVKFSLSGNKGLGIFFPDYPASQQINCADNVPINVLEETTTAGGSSLTYDAGSDRYQYNWKTEKSWTGCRVLVVKLADGTEHIAYFKFK